MKSLSAVILCGGQSERMGKDKASLIYERQTFLDRIISQLKGINDIYLSVGSDDKYLDHHNISHIQDEYKNKGPLGGIHKALTVCKEDILFVVACDMPFVDSNLAFYLLQYFEEDLDAVIPIDNTGRKHVLAGLYHKKAKEKIEYHLKSGHKKIIDVLNDMNVKYVSINDYKNEKKLMNYNYWDQYQRLLKQSIPVISFVGYSNSGKTTILEKVISKLKDNGIRVAYIKHTHHDIEMVQNKDSYKMQKAGAKISTVISHSQTMIIENKAIDIHELIKKINNVDIILIEGYKNKNFQKILVLNDEKESPVSFDECLAVISHKRITTVNKWFNKDDVQGIYQLIIDILRKEFI